MRAAALLVALGAARALAAQPAAPEPRPAATTTRDAAVATVRLATARPRLDGRLDDAAWATADSITDFTQRDPAEGQPASERTVVKLLATDDGLWIALRAGDRDPGGIRHAQLRRDGDFDTDDAFTVMLSPMEDRRTGFLFSVNPNGALQDAEILTFESENRDWDGVWDARARIDAEGWSAEIHIPWQTLRYRPSAATWSVNFRRFIRRKNEQLLWRGWRRTEGIRFLERAGTVAGFDAVAARLGGALPGRATAELRPYVTATARTAERSYATGAAVPVRDGAVIGDAGLDAKLAPAPTLTLDLTANADFAQAEVDRQVVNLTRFPLFFPEQRPFFTEGAGIFEFGRLRQTQLFYSRRIGLGPDGAPIPLLAGARLTGRLGAQQLGVLAARTGGADPATDLVARVRRDLLGRGYLGAMATLQDRAGAPAALAGGVDANLPYIVRGQNLVILGTAALSRDGAAGAAVPSYGRLVMDFPNDEIDAVARLDRVGTGFAPPLGFVQQDGITRFAGSVSLTPRPRRLGALGPRLTRWGVRKLDVEALSWNVVRRLADAPNGPGLDNASFSVRPIGAEMESGAEWGVDVDWAVDAPTRDFEIVDGVTLAPRRYAWRRVAGEFHSSPARPLRVDVGGSTGGFYDGTSRELSATLSGRLEPHLLASADWSLTRAALPEGRFTARVLRLRVDGAVSPRLTSAVFGQWDSESRRVAFNARLRWTQTPGSDAYVVWNSAWPSGLDGGIPWRRPARGALIVKYVRYLRT